VELCRATVAVTGACGPRSSGRAAWALVAPLRIRAPQIAEPVAMVVMVRFMPVQSGTDVTSHKNFGEK